MNKIKVALVSLGGILGFVPFAHAEELSTSTISTLVSDNIAQLKDVAGDNLPVIILCAVLIALVFVAYRWFKRFTGVHK